MKTTKPLFVLAVAVLAAAVTLVQPGRAEDGEDRSAESGRQVVLYLGRSKSLVEPLIAIFETETGIDVKVRAGKTAQLALALLEQGEHSDADLFWAQDAGALGAVSKAGLFRQLPNDVVAKVVAPFENPRGYWVATSGRARVLAYAVPHIDEAKLPVSVFDLTDPKWAGRVGLAPSNASFLSFITAMRVVHGQAKTRTWLEQMRDNGAKRYPKNTPIIKALAAGEIHLGLPNHYYLLRFKKADENFPVEQRFFAPGDIGNLVNVAGVGVLKSAKNNAAAERFVRFLLSHRAQQYFTSEVFEYPVIDDIITNKTLLPQKQLAQIVPRVNLDELADLAGTRKLMKQVGLQ